VIAYHLNVPWAQGGMLGVGVFFTLSGYLITDLLLDHYRRRGDLGLPQFWVRRARRLLPALFLMLVIVSAWVAIFDASQLAEVRRQVVSAALYFANWSTIAAHHSYFARFAPALPLDHLWSLSIEEQFYLAWPWLLWLGVRLLPSRRLLALITLLGAGASAIVMGHLYHPGYDPTRAYEGTDSRAFGLLIGAALAMILPKREAHLDRRRRTVEHQTARDLAGVAGLIGILVLVWRTSPFTPFLYPVGFVLLSVASVAVIAAVASPSSALGELLGCAPLRWLGVRSYGIYLWQWPIIVLWGRSDAGFSAGRAALQVAVTIVVAGLSWRYVEEPIRSGALGRLWLRARSRTRARHARRVIVALSATASVLLALTVCALGGVLPRVSAGPRSPHEIARLPSRLPDPRSPVTRVRTPPVTRPLRPATRTSCRSVVYIGDSTSEGETSPDYIPNPHRRLQAQLAKIGVAVLHPEISGGRSIVETIEDLPNAQTVARRWVSKGFQGCWILALGTNDAADLAVGSNVGLRARIARMMSIIGDRPVLWVDAITLVASGPYAESGMQHWNEDLLSDCSRYPTMRVFDWAAFAKRKWFIPDGIHYYTPGYEARAHLIAAALVTAFPKRQPPAASCLVR